MFVSVGCQKDNPENWSTIKKLYKTYKNGEISECKYKGETVYSGALNAYDAGNNVYDASGKQIGSCNYAWGTVDDICGELENCKTIYRVEDNIWGRDYVDEYNLE